MKEKHYFLTDICFKKQLYCIIILLLKNVKIFSCLVLLKIIQRYLRTYLIHI